LSNVSVVDAHGLGVLLQLREQILGNGTHFRLMNVNERLSKVFEITRLNTVFEIDPGVAYFPAAPRVLMAA
jgi:anti-anti-sigma factor